jgi:hypothetical protein
VSVKNHVQNIAFSFTITGGKIGVNHFAINFDITKLIIANCNITISHFKYQNLEPETSDPFSISIQSFFSPIS